MLETGRAEKRRKLALGFITEAEAQRAVHAMNLEEDRSVGTPMYGRLLRLHENNPDAALRYLLGNEDPETVFGPEPVDHGAMRLQEYHEKVYAPWRSQENPRSWRTEEGHWRRLLAELGDKLVGTIDAHTVADYLDGLVVERKPDPRYGQPVSGATKRLHRSAIQALLNHAHRLRHIPEHVDLAVFTIKGSTRRVRVKPAPLSIDELQRLLDASGPKHRVMWAVGAGEGLRPSEVCRMQWEDVRFDTRTLVVRGEKTEQAADEIPLTPLAYRELRGWWVRQGQPAVGVVFPAGANGGPADVGYDPDSGYRTALATSARRAKIGRRVNMYLLRDSFATIAWSLGIEQDVARRILRHADLEMLNKVYCRPRPADLVARVAAFDLPGR